MEEKKSEKKKQLTLTVPDLIPVNERIYTKNFKQDFKTKTNILVPGASAVMGSALFIVAIADPSITYKDEKGKERKLETGDVVRPFVVSDAKNYSHVNDLFMGETYILFHWTEIAAVIPRDRAKIEFAE